MGKMPVLDGLLKQKTFIILEESICIQKIMESEHSMLVGTLLGP